MTFEEVRDRAIEHCQFLTDYVKGDPEKVDRAIAELCALVDVYLITSAEADGWIACIIKSAYHGGTK